MRNRKQRRKNRTRERQRKRSEKGGCRKRLKRNKGKHRNFNNKNCLFRGENSFFQLKAKKGKQRKTYEK